jgi:hypothetical protein
MISVRIHLEYKVHGQGQGLSKSRRTLPFCPYPHLPPGWGGEYRQKAFRTVFTPKEMEKIPDLGDWGDGARALEIRGGSMTWARVRMVRLYVLFDHFSPSE